MVFWDAGASTGPRGAALERHCRERSRRLRAAAIALGHLWLVLCCEFSLPSWPHSPGRISFVFPRRCGAASAPGVRRRCRAEPAPAVPASADETDRLRSELEELRYALAVERSRSDVLRREKYALQARVDHGPSWPTSNASNSNYLSLLSFRPHRERWTDDGHVAEGIERLWRRLGGQIDPENEFRVLRQNVFSGRWTLYAAGGAPPKKPAQYGSERLVPRAADQPTHEERCPFCRGSEHRTPDPVLVVGTDGELYRGPEFPKDWLVRVVPNIFPLLSFPKNAYGEAFERKLAEIPHSTVAEGPDQHRSARSVPDDSMHPEMDATGFCEVVIEGSRHNGLLALVGVEQVSASLRALQERGRVLNKAPGVKQVLYFKQYGPLSGGSLVHPHMQVIALPMVTPNTENHILRRCEYHRQCGRCLKCDVQRDEILGSGPASARLVYKSEHFLVAVPFSARSYHVSIVPLEHRHSWLDIPREEVEDLAAVLQLLMEVLYHLLDDPSYVLNIFSVDSEALIEQAPDNIREAFHWGIEVQPRTPDDFGGMELASAIRVVDGLPEDYAAQLRQGFEERLALRRQAEAEKPT